MDITELTLKLIILLIPGIISANLYGKLTFRSKPKDSFMFILTAIVLGVLSYLSLQIIQDCKVLFLNEVCCYKREFITLDAFENIGSTSAIPYSEVLWSSILSVVVGFIAAGIDNWKIINRLGSYFRLSNKFGEENLYMKFLNSPDVEYVYVRDIPNNLTYFGYIESYSETENFKEIVLGNVSVYDYPDSNLLYDLEKAYLCFPANNIVFELAKNIDNGTEAQKDGK